MINLKSSRFVQNRVCKSVDNFIKSKQCLKQVKDDVIRLNQ